MKTVIEHRASIILYNVLKSQTFKGKFLVPANVCPIVPAVFFKADIPFQFMDIDPKTLCMDSGVVLEKLENDKDISGILYVRTYGANHNAEPFFEKVKKYNDQIFLIDDRCLSRPESLTNIKRTNADSVLYSTGYAKYVELGYGGFAYLKDAVVYKRHQLFFNKEDHENLQQQFRSSMAKGKFTYFDTNWLGNTEIELEPNEYFKSIRNNIEEVDDHKAKINDVYMNEIPYKFQVSPMLQKWRFNILVNNKEKVLEEIFKNNLFASSHYASLVNIFGVGNGDKAKQLHDKTINLFNDFRFNLEDALKVSKIVKKYAQ